MTTFSLNERLEVGAANRGVGQDGVDVRLHLENAAGDIDQLFLSPVFRRAYDQLVQAHGTRRGAVEYLRLLKLASEVGEADVAFMLIEFTCAALSALERGSDAAMAAAPARSANRAARTAAAVRRLRRPVELEPEVVHAC